MKLLHYCISWNWDNLGSLLRYCPCVISEAIIKKSMAILSCASPCQQFKSNAHQPGSCTCPPQAAGIDCSSKEEERSPPWEEGWTGSIIYTISKVCSEVTCTFWTLVTYKTGKNEWSLWRIRGKTSNPSSSFEVEIPLLLWL